MRSGWLVYALCIPAAAISVVLLLGGKSWSFWLGGFLFVIYAAYGTCIDYVRGIEWRNPLRVSILVPYVVLYLSIVISFYVPLGGNRLRSMATLLVFGLCGVMHDVLVMVIFRRPFCAFTAIFAICGILAVVNRRLKPNLHQERWPIPANALVNVSCLALSVYADIQLQVAIFR